MVRTFKHQVEALHGINLDANHPMLVWAVRYAGQILSRAQRSTLDGKTAYELRKGKPYRRKLPPFGEAVAYMKAGKRRAKLADRFFIGLYLGLVEASDEVVVGTDKGVFRVRSIKRLPAVQRSAQALLRDMKGLPWCMEPTQAQQGSMQIRSLVAAAPVVLPQDLLPLP